MIRIHAADVYKLLTISIKDFIVVSQPNLYRIGLFTLVSPASCSRRGTHRARRTHAAFRLRQAVR